MNNYVEFLIKKNKEAASDTKKMIETKRIIDIMNKILKGVLLTEEEFKIFNEHVNNLTNHDTNTLLFVAILNKNKMPLDEVQKQVCIDFVNARQMQYDTLHKLYSQIINENNDLIKKLSSDIQFTDFDALKKSFKDNAVSVQDQISIIQGIIIDNYAKKAEIIPTGKKKIINTDEEVATLFSEFGLDYSLISEDNKILLKTGKSISEYRSTLTKLETFKNIYCTSRELANKVEDVFVAILLKSSPSSIDLVINTCLENSIDLGGLVSSSPTVLIPNVVNKKHYLKKGKDPDKRSVSGKLNNFLANIEFFKSKGYDVSIIAERCKSVLLNNPVNIKNNYDLLTEIYNINVGESALSGLISPNSIAVIDRFIESSELGLEYIRNNQSRLMINDELLLEKLKIAYLHAKGDTVINAGIESSGLYDNPDTEPFRPFKGKIALRGSFVKDGPKTKEEADEILGLTEYNLDEDVVYALNIETTNGYKPVLDAALFNEPVVAYFEDNFKVDEYTYVIVNTRISRIKFLKICDIYRQINMDLTEDLIKVALTFNSLLTADDTLVIDKAVKNAIGLSRIKKVDSNG